MSTMDVALLLCIVGAFVAGRAAGLAQGYIAGSRAAEPRIRELVAERFAEMEAGRDADGDETGSISVVFHNVSAEPLMHVDDAGRLHIDFQTPNRATLWH